MYSKEDVDKIIAIVHSDMINEMDKFKNGKCIRDFKLYRDIKVMALQYGWDIIDIRLNNE